MKKVSYISQRYISLIFLIYSFSGNLNAQIYKNQSETPEVRAKDVLSKLSFEEKLSLTGGNKMVTTALKRLGLRSAQMTDASQGVRLKCLNAILPQAERKEYKSVSFPGMLPLASTWNTKLAHQFGVAMGRQCRSLGVDILLGPGINMHRLSTGGRVFEYLGEDPILAAQMVVPYIQGVQSQGVIATAKHFIANDTEMCRHFVNSNVDERTLQEIYLVPWKAAIQKGEIGAIMTGNNQINGIPCCMNKALLKDLLRREWGFKGIAMTDWQNTRYYTDKQQLVLESGESLLMPDSKRFTNYLREIYKQKQTDKKGLEQMLDRMILPNLRTLFASGIYDRKKNIPQKGIVSYKQAEDIALQTAEEAICLLKNKQQILPISPRKKILLLGEPEIYTGTGSGFVTGYNNITFAQGLKSIYKKNIRVKSTEEVNSKDFSWCDVVLFNMNKEGAEGRDIPFELTKKQQENIQKVLKSKRPIVVLASACASFNMPWLNKIDGLLWCYYLGQNRGKALSKIISGRISPSGRLPMTLEKKWEDSPDPKYNYFGDQPFWLGHHQYRKYWIEGEINKKTPLQVQKIMQPNLMPHEQFNIDYKEGLFIGYRWYDKQKIKPQFPFGFGLSYTNFTYERMHLSQKSSPDYPVIAEVTVKNTGKYKAKEVIQIYVKTPHNKTITEPIKELAGFTKISLAPNESKTVKIALHKNAFAYYDVETRSWKLHKGTYKIYVGKNTQRLLSETLCSISLQ